MPILPDYLATVNNRTSIIPTSNYASVSAVGAAAAGAKSINASGGLGILGSAAAAQHLAYRNLTGIAYQQKQQAAVLQQPHVMTKHPIPGKSMVNLSLIQFFSDDNNNNNVLMATPISEQQRNLLAVDTSGENKKNESSVRLIKQSKSKNNKAPETMLKKRVEAEVNLTSENGSIGILLAMKALVQLIFNPIIGNMSTKYGYRVPIVMGTFFLLMSSLGKCRIEIICVFSVWKEIFCGGYSL